MAVLWRDKFDPVVFLTPHSLTDCLSVRLSFPSESVRCARVLVTGASTGIGEQVAYHYAKTGAQVVITARREYALQKIDIDSLCTRWLSNNWLNFLSYVDMASAALPVLEQSAGSMIVVSSLLAPEDIPTRPTQPTMLPSTSSRPGPHTRRSHFTLDTSTSPACAETGSPSSETSSSRTPTHTEGATIPLVKEAPKPTGTCVSSGQE
ncbi:hydroxysteroid 11-beta-dehydrogenase 1-like protein [Oncorhynchus kisutch]|uniref:hydroxysteroid 11-beta-dehydrogenase 1-like protein n=1 Tax=Oncorhynchus kisutch TaxID=8019 RepID=UPI0012DD26F2|nr:hydroxysteroid 11-beta-dehydrogenase 1-like protein [Oncorhynchus kisutch]